VQTSDSAGYDNAAYQFDIRATLTSTRHGSASSRPDLTLFVHGTPDAPQVMTDVSSLASWLALRTIERETQRLDAIERGDATARAQRPQAPAPAPPPQTAPEAAAPAMPQPVTAAPVSPVAPLPPPVEVRPVPGTARPQPKASPPLVLTPQSARP